MNVKIAPAEVKNPKTKKGDPYLLVKTVSGKVLTSWKEYQYIWHKIIVGQEIVVEIKQEGNYTYIVGIPGIEPPNQSGGTTLYKTPKDATTGQNQPLTGQGQTAWDRFFVRLEGLEKKIDWLIEERKTLGLPPNIQRITPFDKKEIKIEDTNGLPDLNNPKNSDGTPF